MTSFIVLCTLVALAGVAFAYLRARETQRLLGGPRDETWLRVSLAAGANESPKRMLRTLRDLGPELMPDSGERARGERQVRLVAIATRPSPDAQAVLRTYVACPPNLEDVVRETLRTNYGAISIERVTSPLAEFTPQAAAT